MQLDLFQWYTLAAGSGYRCLATMDFSGARAHFARVLQGIPAHAEAGRGMRDLEHWQEVFRALEGVNLEERPVFLWEKINDFVFRESESHRLLRRSLLSRLLAMLEEDDFYQPPDLCRGYLLLQLDEYGAAVAELRSLLQHVPDNGRLHGYLADALWQSGKQEEAATAYLTGLLLEPNQVNLGALCNPDLADLIREHGPALAPVYGYLAGLFPLLEPPVRATAPEALAYAHLRQAELARVRDDHQTMVGARRALKLLAPALLQEYLDWLAASTKN